MDSFIAPPTIAAACDILMRKGKKFAFVAIDRGKPQGPCVAICIRDQPGYEYSDVPLTSYNEGVALAKELNRVYEIDHAAAAQTVISTMPFKKKNVRRG